MPLSRMGPWIVGLEFSAVQCFVGGIASRRRKPTGKVEIILDKVLVDVAEVVVPRKGGIPVLKISYATGMINMKTTRAGDKTTKPGQNTQTLSSRGTLIPAFFGSADTLGGGGPSATIPSSLGPQ